MPTFRIRQGSQTCELPRDAQEIGECHHERGGPARCSAQENRGQVLSAGAPGAEQGLLRCPGDRSVRTRRIIITRETTFVKHPARRYLCSMVLRMLV